MQKVQCNSFFKVVLCFILVSVLSLSGGLIINTAEAAAAKPSIPSKITIGTGSGKGNFDFYSRELTYSISVSNPDKKATYTFTSSNTKVLTVKAKGSSALLTGLKAGTATITCNQKLNGKTTKVGTCTVTIINATVKQDEISELPLGPTTLHGDVVMLNRNIDATYTYTCTSKNFTMKEVISKFDGMEFIKHEYNATAAGTYTVTVKETYNKATRTVGTLKYTVKKATVIPKEILDLEDSMEAFSLINNPRSDVSYRFEYDKNIVKFIPSDKVPYFEGIAIGTTDIKVYEVNAKTPDKSVLIGTCKFTVREAELYDLGIDFEEISGWLGYDPVNVYVNKVPYNAPGTITVTSSDTKVATVKESDKPGTFVITPVGVGTTTITITCGDITEEREFSVYDDDDEDWE